MTDRISNIDLLDEVVELVARRTGRSSPLVLLHIMDADAFNHQAGKATGVAVVVSNMHNDLIATLLKNGLQILQARNDIEREDKA